MEDIVIEYDEVKAHRIDRIDRSERIGIKRFNERRQYDSDEMDVFAVRYREVGPVVTYFNGEAFRDCEEAVIWPIKACTFFDHSDHGHSHGYCGMCHSHKRDGNSKKRDRRFERRADIDFKQQLEY
jgi:hypothetical protein